jgi:hypothetical protein
MHDFGLQLIVGSGYSPYCIFNKYRIVAIVVVRSDSPRNIFVLFEREFERSLKGVHLQQKFHDIKSKRLLAIATRKLQKKAQINTVVPIRE